MEQQEEISFVDLVIVLIRRRRIVIALTLAAFVLALGYFYAAPAIGLTSRDSYTVDDVFVPVRFPPSIKNEIGMDLPSYAMSIATSPVNLIGPVWAMGLESTKSMTGPDDPSFLSLLKKDFIGKGIYTCTVNGDGALVFSVNNKNRSVAETFLKTMVGVTDLKLRQEVSKRARVIADSMETVLVESEKKGLPVSVEARQMFLSSRSFTNEDTSLFQELSGVETSRERVGRSKGAIVTVAVGFILGILLAFVVEAVMNIKKNEDTMRKIRAAMAHGKRSK